MWHSIFLGEGDGENFVATRILVQHIWSKELRKFLQHPAIISGFLHLLLSKICENNTNYEILL